MIQSVRPLSLSIESRDVEPEDLPVFFAHQQNPETVAMAAFSSRDAAAFDQHWAKILADATNLITTVVVDDGVAKNVLSFTREGETRGRVLDPAPPRSSAPPTRNPDDADDSHVLLILTEAN